MKTSYREKRRRQLEEFDAWSRGLVGLMPAQVRERWRERIADVVERNMNRAQRLHDERAEADRQAREAGASQPWKFDRACTVGNEQYPRGCLVPPHIRKSEGWDNLVDRRLVRPGTGPVVKPKVLPPPEPARPNPSQKVIAEIIDDSIASFHDPVAAYRNAEAALRQQMDPRDHGKIRDLISTVQAGYSLWNAAGQRVAARAGIPYRRPAGLL
jgi:hypothetical protein